MWRHLKMAKRGGRCHDKSGINGTSPGELAVQCPACPIPFVNLPPDWKSTGKDTEYVNCELSYCSLCEHHYPRYLYYQAFGIDACFRFKRRQVSSYEKDPELGPGYAYLVAWEPYREYLRGFTDQQEVCSIYFLPGRGVDVYCE